MTLFSMLKINLASSNTMFTISPGQRYHIDVNVMGADASMHKMKMLADTGNDITLLTVAAAQQLGYDPSKIGTPFPVAGITNQPSIFKKVWNVVQLGQLRPMWIRMGLATSQGALAENLLGRQDVLDNGRLEAIYSNKGVQYVELHTDVNAGAGANLAHSFREKFRPMMQPLHSHYGYWRR